MKQQTTIESSRSSLSLRSRLNESLWTVNLLKMFARSYSQRIINPLSELKKVIVIMLSLEQVQNIKGIVAIGQELLLLKNQSNSMKI